jgi:hypothetical protein
MSEDPGMDERQDQGALRMALAVEERLAGLSVRELWRRWEEAHPHAAGIGPSDVGRCPRQVQYRLDEPERDESSGVSMIGSLVHLGLAAITQELEPGCMVEHKTLPPGMDRPGTVDLAAHGRVRDYKTKSCRGFDSVAARGAPWPSDVEQVGVYALGLADEGHDVVELEVVYVDRCGGRDLSYVVPFDPAAAMDALLRLHAWLDDYEAGKELPRAGRHPGDPVCTWCPFVADCWQTDAGGREPVAWSAAPEQVADVARRYRAAKEEADRLADEAKALREQLRGWHGFTFTDDHGVQRSITWTQPKPPAPVFDQEQAILTLQLHGLEVPTKPGQQASSALRTDAAKAKT